MAGDRSRSRRSAVKGRSAESSVAATPPHSRAPKCWSGVRRSGCRWRRWRTRKPLATSSPICSAAISDYLLSTVMQSVACNGFHSITERAARWLLHVQDRAGDRIELTQEAFAGLARSSAHDRQRGDQGTAVGRSDRAPAAEWYASLDRAGLKRRSCECYERLEEHYAAVIGSRAAPASAADQSTSLQPSVSPARNGTRSIPPIQSVRALRLRAFQRDCALVERQAVEACAVHRRERLELSSAPSASNTPHSFRARRVH